jgi:ABC-type sugar transport system ATPase subunit
MRPGNGATTVKDILLEMDNIQKRFAGTQALAGVHFEVRPGEVHVLLGENGAGKSTLMKILTGVHQPDEGTIRWHGRPIRIRGPADSLKLGIGMVYQELTLVKNLSVFENIYLGRMPRTRILPFLRWKTAREQAAALLKTMKLDLDIRKPVRSLDLGLQQLVEIARAISRDAKLIILDEPTSALTENEVNLLFETIRKLKSQGLSFIYITHKLKEVFTIGDRVTVLRDGRSIRTFDSLEGVSENDLIRLMVGRTLEDQYPKEINRRRNVILKVRGFGDGSRFHDISFDLHEGEVLGVAGLVGSGTSELAEALFGLSERKVTGNIELFGQPYKPTNPTHAIRRRIGMLKKDRKGSLMLHMPIFRNMSVATFGRFARWGFRKKKEEMAVSEELVRKLKIDCRDVRQAVGELSGGNQQKVAIAKWICNESRLIIMDDPTRGIDVGAKVEVYKLMNELTSRGVGILFISSELPELLGMSDRILVMREGRLVSDRPASECTQEFIMQKAAGSE